MRKKAMQQLLHGLLRGQGVNQALSLVRLSLGAGSGVLV